MDYREAPRTCPQASVLSFIAGFTNFCAAVLLMPWLMLALREPELLPEVCLVSYAP